MNWDKGTELKTIDKVAITREHLKAYAAASGDNNAIHLDDEFAKSAGFPSVIAHGMLSMAFLADVVRKNFPENEFKLQNLQARFRKVAFPGDVLSCGGKVREVLSPDRYRVEIWAKNQKAELVTDGEAIVEKSAVLK